MPSEAFRAVVIPIVIGAWTNAALWGFEMCMVYLYCSRSWSRDGRLMRTAVAICAIADTACTAVEMSCVYGYTVTNWGNEEYLLRQGWQFPAYIFLTATVALVVQSYFIQRYFRMSRNFIITGVLALLALLAVGGSSSLALIVAVHSKYSERSKVRVSAILWVGIKAVCDVSIATALIVQLLRYRSKHPLKQTKKLLSTLCVLAVETGTPTALIAVAGLITYLQNNSSNAPTGIAFNLGRAYSITFLMNLLMRQYLATSGQTNADSEFALPKSNETRPSMLRNAISVQDELAIQVKGERGSSEGEKAVHVKISGSSGDFTAGEDVPGDLNAFRVSYPPGSRVSSQVSFTS
ncbi:hypothetical protein BT69DRAFT_664160 [Atractiella rhizophila]|nr:hypothetical protein BT69DRAFT_664160 [Atractiella rhizophila]